MLDIITDYYLLHTNNLLAIYIHDIYIYIYHGSRSDL